MQGIRDITLRVWPTVRAMAADIGEDYETARKWLLRGRLPERVWPALIQKSAHTPHPLTADMLMRANLPRKKRRHDAMSPEEAPIRDAEGQGRRR